MAGSMDGAINDQELFRRMSEGDEDAFLALYRRRQAGLHRFVARMCGRPEIAEEVVQDVFLCLLRGRTNYDPRRSALSTYLYGMARNLVLKHLERGSRFKPLEEGFDAEEPAAGQLAMLEERMELEGLRKAILGLPPVYREVLVLCDLEELSYAQAAAALECPVGSVRSRLHRARGLLESKLRAAAGEPAPRVVEESTGSAPVGARVVAQAAGPL